MDRNTYSVLPPCLSLSIEAGFSPPQSSITVLQYRALGQGGIEEQTLWEPLICGLMMGQSADRPRPSGEGGRDTYLCLLKCETRVSSLASELHYRGERPISTSDLDSMPGENPEVQAEPHPRSCPGPGQLWEAVAEQGRLSPKELPRRGGTHKEIFPAGKSPSSGSAKDVGWGFP